MAEPIKTTLLAVLFSAAAILPLFSDIPAISVVEQSPQGETKIVASLRAEDAATHRDILQRWENAKKAFPKNRRHLYGPDSGFVALTITNGQEKIVVRSWHPLFEANPHVVVTSRGVETLGARNREEVLESDEAWYREARRVFDELLTFTRSKAQ
jgi:hypothetical protein